MSKSPNTVTPEQAQRLASIIQRWKARYTPRPDVLAQIEASPMWQMFCHPMYPSAALVMSLSEQTTPLLTPYLKQLRFNFNDQSTLDNTTQVVLQEEIDTLIAFFEALDRMDGIIELTIRYAPPGGDSPLWIHMWTTTLHQWFPGAEGYRLVIAHNVSASRTQRSASLVQWGADGSDTWRTLVPTPKPMANPLTPRELEVLGYLAKGWASRRIAEHLGLSTYTVDTHRSNMLLKSGCSNTPDLVRFALENGLV